MRSAVKKYLRIGGSILILLSFLLLVISYWNVWSAQIDYFLNPGEDNKIVAITDDLQNDTEEVTTDNPDNDSNEEIVFIDPDFGIYIPKIKANSTVVKDVNPYNSSEYNKALENGIAHAVTSSLPNEGGNVFLFAHSAVNFYEARNYNVYFYLINKLEAGDTIYVSYNSKIYKYTVSGVKIVTKDKVEYLQSGFDTNTLTLMTCWPNGTDWRRVIVTADLITE